MKTSTKVQITLSEIALEKLTELCEKKGVNRSAIIAIAIDAFHKSEKGEG